MTTSEISRAVRCGRNSNLRAAWVIGHDSDGDAAATRETLLLYALEAGDGWVFGTHQTSSGRFPFLGSIFPGVLKAFLSVPPERPNLPLLTCHFGAMILDRDGAGEALSEKAAESWLAGPSEIEDRDLPRLRWGMQRIVASAERRASATVPVRDNSAFALGTLVIAMERTTDCLCRLRGLWPVPLAEFSRVAADERYGTVATLVREFLRSDDPRYKNAVLLRAASSVLGVLPPPAPAAVSHGVNSVWAGERFRRNKA